MNIRYLEAHNFYKKLLIEGLADSKLHQNFVDLFNQWNKTVFPQAEFEIIPDSQAQSADEGSISKSNTRSANPKNPDVADALRLLSFETNEDGARSEALPDADNWGLDNHSIASDDIYVNHPDDMNIYDSNSTMSTWIHPHSMMGSLDSPTNAQHVLEGIGEGHMVGHGDDLINILHSYTTHYLIHHESYIVTSS